MKKVILGLLILATAFTLASSVKCYDCSRFLSDNTSCNEGIESELERDEFTTDCAEYGSRTNADMCVTYITNNIITRGCAYYYAKTSDPHTYLTTKKGALAVSTCHTDYCNYGKLTV